MGRGKAIKGLILFNFWEKLKILFVNKSKLKEPAKKS